MTGFVVIVCNWLSVYVLISLPSLILIPSKKDMGFVILLWWKHLEYSKFKVEAYENELKVPGLSYIMKL